MRWLWLNQRTSIEPLSSLKMPRVIFLPVRELAWKRLVSWPRRVFCSPIRMSAIFVKLVESL